MLHGERVVPRRRPRAIRPKDCRSRRAATSSVTATSGSGHEPPPFRGCPRWAASALCFHWMPAAAFLAMQSLARHACRHPPYSLFPPHVSSDPSFRRSEARAVRSKGSRAGGAGSIARIAATGQAARAAVACSFPRAMQSLFRHCCCPPYRSSYPSHLTLFSALRRSEAMRCSI